MNRTPIEWTDFSANPVRFRAPDGRVVWACEKLSPGCANCYAEDLSHRYGGARRAGDWNAGTMATLTPFLDEKELRLMLTYKPAAGKRVFVGDMTDIFGEWVPDALLDRLFAVFALRQDVTFQILTKRAERLRDYLTADGRAEAIARCLPTYGTQREGFVSLPLLNVWLGVSVEDQKRADERIPLLLQTPAAVRFISAEPLLGPVDLNHVFIAERNYSKDALRRSDLEPPLVPDAKLDWVIVGGESGNGARPSDVAWARWIVQQCQAAGVAVFVKQLGSHAIDGRLTPKELLEGGAGRPRPADQPLTDAEATDILHDLTIRMSDFGRRLPLRDRKGGDRAEWSEDLRVREFPR